MCKVLQIAPCGYMCRVARKRKPEMFCARTKRDEALMHRAIWQANMQVYGAYKVWHQGSPLFGRAVEIRIGLQGVQKGKIERSTVPDKAASCPLDRVNCQFKADRPNQLEVSDFT
jgi:putative transposase